MGVAEIVMVDYSVRHQATPKKFLVKTAYVLYAHEVNANSNFNLG
jgi:hypothetical protein